MNEEGEITGWDVLCTKAAIHDQIVRRNHEHMNQASATPFGNGDGYDALHGLARQTVMDQIHNGELKWKDPVEEVNRWVDELQATYNQENLADEVNQIGKAISVKEFCRFYKLKQESTESSPSGRHVGHYKVAAKVEDLSWLHTVMINVSLMCGVSLDRWKQSVNIMIEKDPGLPKIHRL